jgi:hypothetical protein
MDIDKSISWLKLSFKQAVIVCIITSILLFADDDVIQKLGLLNFREFAKTWIGVIWLVSLGLLITDSAISGYNVIKKKRSEKAELDSLFQRLEHLSEDEKKFLAYYIDNNTKTQSAEISDGTANGLSNMKIIYRSSNISEAFTSFPWNIQDWAWKYLKANPSCLN